VREAVNDIVKTNMGKLAVIWEDCGYNDLIIQQRCEAVKKHVQVNKVLRFSLLRSLAALVFKFNDGIVCCLFFTQCIESEECPEICKF
jgi:hypothetical protein